MPKLKAITKMIIDTVESDTSYLFISIKDVDDLGDGDYEYSCADAYSLSETDFKIIKDYIKHELSQQFKNEVGGEDLLSQARNIVE